MNYKKLKRRLKKSWHSYDFEKIKSQYATLYNIKLKEKKDIIGIQKAGRLAVDILNHVEEHIKPGITTNYINSLVKEFTKKNNAISAPLNYNGFPNTEYPMTLFWRMVIL